MGQIPESVWDVLKISADLEKVIQRVSLKTMLGNNDADSWPHLLAPVCPISQLHKTENGRSNEKSKNKVQEDI